VDYKDILPMLTPQRYHYDPDRVSAWLSIDEPGASADVLLDYNDETAMRTKAQFVVDQKLGGVGIWHLMAGYVETNPVGNQHPLLSVIRATLP
jgi:GH18 family chitinase